MELQERIIEQASELFFSKGIKSITMSDVANQLGISKRTLYENFNDKEALLKICLEKSILEADRDTGEIISQSENAIDALMKIYAKHLDNVHKMNKSALYDLRKYHSNLYKLVECKQKEGVELFVPLFEKGVEQGLIRNDINFEVLVWLLKGQFRMLMEGDYMPIDKYGITEFWSAIILNFTRGVATTEGSKQIDEIVLKVKKTNS